MYRGKEYQNITEVDADCAVLVNVLNLYEGIQTFGSCSGHSKREFWIGFNVQDINDMIPVLHVINGNNQLFLAWRVEARVDETLEGVCFYLVGPPNCQAHGSVFFNDTYLQALKIAELMLEMYTTGDIPDEAI